MATETELAAAEMRADRYRRICEEQREAVEKANAALLAVKAATDELYAKAEGWMQRALRAEQLLREVTSN